MKIPSTYLSGARHLNKHPFPPKFRNLRILNNLVLSFGFQSKMTVSRIEKNLELLAKQTPYILPIDLARGNSIFFRN